MKLSWSNGGALPWAGKAPASTGAGARLPGEQLRGTAPGPGGQPSGHKLAEPWKRRWPTASWLHQRGHGWSLWEGIIHSAQGFLDRT